MANQNIFQQIARKYVDQLVENLSNELRDAVQGMWAGTIASAPKRAYTKKAKAASAKPAKKAPKAAKAQKAPKAKRAPKSSYDQDTLNNIMGALNLSPEGAKASDIIDALKIEKAAFVKAIKYALGEGLVKTTGKTRKTLYFDNRKTTKSTNGAASYAPVEAAAEATA